MQSQTLGLDKFTALDTGRYRLADISSPEVGKGWIQPRSLFWMTQTKPPTSSYYWLHVYAAASATSKEGLCWVTASTKPVTLQMVQPWQLREWELHLVLLLLCKLCPQSIHLSLSLLSHLLQFGVTSLHLTFIPQSCDHGKHPSKTTSVPV